MQSIQCEMQNLICIWAGTPWETVFESNTSSHAVRRCNWVHTCMCVRCGLRRLILIKALWPGRHVPKWFWVLYLPLENRSGIFLSSVHIILLSNIGVKQPEWLTQRARVFHEIIFPVPFPFIPQRLRHPHPILSYGVPQEDFDVFSIRA